MSSWLDSIIDGVSDAAEGVGDWVGGLFDDGGSTVMDEIPRGLDGKPIDDTDSWLDKIFTPKNVVDGLGYFGSAYLKGEASDEAARKAAEATQSTIALENLKFQHDMALLQAKLAAGGGGGGGGGSAQAQIAAQKAIARFQQRAAAKEAAMRSNQDSSALIVQALGQLSGDAQKPLVIR